MKKTGNRRPEKFQKQVISIRKAASIEATASRGRGTRALSSKDGGAKVHVLACNNSTSTDGYWDNSTPAVLRINSGDIVEIQTDTHLKGRMVPGVDINHWMKWYKEMVGKYPDTCLYPDPLIGVEKIIKGPNHASLTGPIYVDVAEPGDILQVEILEIIPIDYGFNLNPETSFAKAGLIPEDFPKGKVRWYKVDIKNMKSKFLPGIEVPLRPFPGTIGVELPDPGRWSNLPPGRYGGNIDNKELVAGTVIYIPIGVKGAGLKTGDSHLAQGDGEVNLNGLESAFRKIALKVTVRKDLKDLVNWPMISTPTHWITMGFHMDLLHACKIVVRESIRFLNKYYGLPEDEAYAFCSIAVDLHVTQLVDFVLGVHAMIPKSSFVGKRYAKKNGLLLHS